MEQRISRR